jgi:hypothetical protein
LELTWLGGEYELPLLAFYRQLYKEENDLHREEAKDVSMRSLIHLFPRPQKGINALDMAASFKKRSEQQALGILQCRVTPDAPLDQRLAIPRC